MLAGLLKADTGEALLLGRPVRRADAASRRRIGLISHHSLLYDGLTALENLVFVARLYGLDRPRERALACATRLLDLGFFRIGSEDYAEENDTYGLATMQKRHVTVKGDVVSFDYEAKGGQRRLHIEHVIQPNQLVATRRARSAQSARHSSMGAN